MRSNVEWRRHGCGQLIGLRESCARCADKARATLHAEGVATLRGEHNCEHPWERFDHGTDQCGLCGAAGRRLRQQRRELAASPAPGKHVVSVTPEQIQHAFDAIDAAREAHRGRVAELRTGYTKPTLGQAAEATSSLTYYSRPPSAKCDHPQLRKDYTSGTCPDCEGTVSWFRGGSCFTIDKRSRREGMSTPKLSVQPAKPEPPPVGAEVSYEVARRK